MALIAARDVRRVYRTGNVDVRALDGVSLNIESGQLTTIVGPSGSGKSTLLNILGGTDQPTSGSVVCDGVEIENLSEAGLTKYRRERVGFVFQFYNLIPTLTAAENVGIACRGIKGAIEPSEMTRSALAVCVGMSSCRWLCAPGVHRPLSRSGFSGRR